MLAVVPSGCRIKEKRRLRWRRASRLWFAGQRYDAVSGLNYNYYRDGYEPGTGRYSQPDPIGLNGGVNLYGYVGGNPLTRIDPFGLAQPAPMPTGAPSFPQAPGITRIMPPGAPAANGTWGRALLGRAGGVGMAALGGWELGSGINWAIETMVGSPGTALFDIINPESYSANPDLCKPAKPDAEPGDLCEQLALAEAKAGAGFPIMGPMVDEPRLVAHYGAGPWVKMQHKHRCPDGRLLVIHYFTNGRGLNVELKFK